MEIAFIDKNATPNFVSPCRGQGVHRRAGRSTLANAPKDVRRLEALKPPNVPGMRYELAVAKERRLEVATRPAMKANDKKVRSYDDDDDDDDNTRDSWDKQKRNGGEEDGNSDKEEEKKEEQKSKKSMPRKKRKPAVINEADLKNVAALKEQDDVQEGIAWSNSESD